MTSLYQRLKHSYYKGALARSERELETLEKMFEARKKQIRAQQDNWVCKLWASHPLVTKNAPAPNPYIYSSPTAPGSVPRLNTTATSEWESWGDKMRAKFGATRNCITRPSHRKS